MNKNTKIVIIAIIIIMLAAGFFAFFVGKPNVPPKEAVSPSGGFPDTGNSAGAASSKDIGLKDGRSSAGEIKKTTILTQLTKNAISGAAYYGTSTALYMEKATGNIYKIKLDGSDKVRLSNTTVPETFEAFWSYKSDKMAVRYFSDAAADDIKLAVKTILVSISHLLKATSTAVMEAELKGATMPTSVSEMAVSPQEDKIFYLNQTENATEGVVADFSNKNQKKIFELAFGEFNVSWPAKDIVVLLTKPSSKAKGYLYFLNPKTGSLTRTLGDLNGLIASVSPDGEKILFNFVSQGEIKTSLFDIKQKTSSDVGFATLADKCAWSSKNKNIVYCAAPQKIFGSDYPDSWYQGTSFFDDGIWSKNTLTGENQNILERFGADIINLRASSDDKYLIFTDKIDGTLWSLKLKTAF